MVLTSPLMLFGLLALPALAAVYWLRSRSRRTVVSSLVLWTDLRRPRQGGRILNRMQTPLTLFLELLAIAMLVMAAAGPAMLKRDAVRPLLVVLDDSYSMRARGDDGTSPRERAAAALDEELETNSYVVRFIQAGPRARLLGEPVCEPARVRAILDQWTCENAAADLSAATLLAAELGGPTARILVLTDREPSATLESGSTEWWAFGQQRPNMAFTAATRTRGAEGERVLLEVANLSSQPAHGTLTLEGGNLSAPRKSPVALAGGASRQFFLNLPVGSLPLGATLDDDALAIDNRVLLLPESSKPLRVSIDLADTKLRRAVTRALDATGQTLEVSERPELVIADRAGAFDADAWRWEIVGGKDAAAYVGPFVIDRNHAITQGLSLQTVIWSGRPDPKPTGLGIITAGNVPLLNEAVDMAGRRRLQMNFALETSNLQDMPDWPILAMNLVAWRRSGLPGVAAPNIRLGQSASIALPRDAKQVELISPDKTVRRLDARLGRVVATADRVGQYAVKTPDAEYAFSCNAVSHDESDLSGCRSGRWGSWADSPTHQDRQSGLSWIFLLVAMAAMTGHAAVVARHAQGRDA